MKKSLKDLEFEDENLIMLHQHVVDHIEECTERNEFWKVQFERMVICQEENTRALKDLTTETKGVVELHRDIQGAARVGHKLQSFMLWLTKWGVIGASVAACISWIADHTQR